MSSERSISFPERCLLAMFIAFRSDSDSATESNFGRWIRIASEAGFLDFDQVGLDFIVIPVLGLPPNSPYRKIAEDRLLNEESRAGKKFESGQALLNLVPLVPTTLSCLEVHKPKQDDFRRSSILTSALFHSYGPSARIFLCRYFGIKSTDTICEFVDAYGDPNIAIKINPLSLMSCAIRDAHRLYVPNGPSLRSILFGQFFREILTPSPIRVAAENSVQRKSIASEQGRDHFEDSFLKACRDRGLDLEDRMLLFSIIYGYLSCTEVVTSNVIAWENKFASDRPLTIDETEERILKLWQQVLFHIQI